MADVFLELLSEEIPARLQLSAQENLKKLVFEELTKVKLGFEAVESFSTPRRLILVIQGLSERTATELEEKRGPSVLAPIEAIDGFCKSMKISKSQLLTKEEKKGAFYYAQLRSESQSSFNLVPEILSKVVKDFPWSKSMRWGSGSFKWVRPLRSVVCILSNDTENKVLPLAFDHISSGDISVGHRFLSPEEFLVSSYEDYEEKMRHRYVIIDRQTRKDKIWHEASNAAFAVGLELVEDENLLEEVTGLVEWPVILRGKIDEEFLALPSEVLQVSMREHQKFFSLRNKKSRSIESFLLVSNISCDDDGQSVIEGNERVLRARLSDAKFFWDNDLRKIKEVGFEKFSEKLKKVIFHNKLGSETDRVKRIVAIAIGIAEMLGTDIEKTRTAAMLCKLDLVSEMVFEFPELQGIIGRYYAEEAGFCDTIFNACYEHYLPKGPLDKAPRKLVSVAVALADKVDTICSFWSINLKPTGSKDPFALRRAAIGIIRILLENKLKFSLEAVLKLGNNNLDFEDLINFFDERIKGQFIEKGIRVDVINSLNSNIYRNISIAETYQRATAIQEFVATEAGKDLIQAYKRAVNILTAEENKDGVEYSLDPQLNLFEEESEVELYRRLKEIDKRVLDDLEKEGSSMALTNLSTLKRPIDNFFSDAKINTENSIVRRNRLCLLNQIKNVMHRVSNFSRID